uniref:Si:ch1073-75f15.2 n=1 Tax=Xiphophorus couchianus TaxID=32473 RepID=A0A3B5MFZ7_9TELE
RMIRMQFDGSSTAEAVNQCSRAVEKLLAYVPVQACQRKTGQPEPEAVHGSVSIKRLTEHYLGETTLALPNIYSPCSLASGDLEPILRVCLLDPSFPAFVEKVQEELEKLQEE